MKKVPCTIDRLRGKMAERHYTAVTLSQYMGKQPDYIRRRVRDPGNFKMTEVYRICHILDIPLAEIPTYFPEKK